MIVRCPSCEARFHLADGRLPEKGARVRCSKCHHRFYVRPPGADAQGSDAELEAESEPDAAPVPRQGKAAPDPEKSAKNGSTARAAKGDSARAKGETTAEGEATARGGQTQKGGASAKGGTSAKSAPAAAKPPKPAAPAPKPEAAKPAKPAAAAKPPAAGSG